MSDQRIIIVGFMGCGKTTVARELAHALNLQCVDLDALIERDEQRSPQELIEQEGETKFREVETRMLRKALGTGTEFVIAAGGGAWTLPENRQLIADHKALAVWLDAPFELCWKRIKSEDHRPLAQTREAAQNLYDKRRPIYSLANFKIPVAPHDLPEDVARKIAAVLLQMTHS